MGYPFLLNKVNLVFIFGILADEFSDTMLAGKLAWALIFIVSKPIFIWTYLILFVNECLSKIIENNNQLTIDDDLLHMIIQI